MSRIIVVGGGFGGFYLATFLEKHEGFNTLLVDPCDYFVYTPLIHQVSVGEVPEEVVKIFYRRILRRTHHIKAKVKRIDFQNKSVLLDNNKLVKYDYVVLASGGTPRRQIPGSANLRTLKTLNDAVAIKKDLLKLLHRRKSVISVVGGGATGTELVGEIASLARTLPTKIKVRHFLRGKSYFSDTLGFDDVIKERMGKLGVNVHPIEPVVEIVDNKLVTQKGIYESDYVVWCTGIDPKTVPSDSEFEKGYLTNEFCEILGLGNAYAIGDVALFPIGDGCAPKLAQVAEKQARFVAEDIIRRENGLRRAPFNPRITTLIVSIGRCFAVARFSDRFNLKGFLSWFGKITYYFSRIFRFKKSLKLISQYLSSIFIPNKFLTSKRLQH